MADRLDRTMMEGGGVNQLYQVLKATIPDKSKLVYFATVRSASPLQVQIDGVPDLLDKDDIVKLEHVVWAGGDRIVLLAMGGATFITLGKIER